MEKYERVWSRLLRGYKRFKDILYDEIEVNRTEYEITQLDIFNRLHYIRQLGTAYLAFPTAKHSRFEHSLQVLAEFCKIANAVESNHQLLGLESPAISSRERLVGRILALVHDLAHIPFAHLIEDETKVVPKRQWLSKVRQDSYFSAIESVIRKNIIDSFREEDVPESGAMEIAGEVLAGLKACLIFEEDPQAMETDNDSKELLRKYRFLASMVGNTICSDLIAYVRMDNAMTGEPKDVSSRLYSYLSIERGEEGDKHFIIRLFKQRHEIRPDIILAIMDLLWQRYSLANRVYFHHVRRITSAMVSRAIASGFESHLLDESTIVHENMGDDQLLDYLAVVGSARGMKAPKLSDYFATSGSQVAPDEAEVAGRLAKKVKQRLLHKRVWESVLYENKRRIDELRVAEKRIDFENTLSELIGCEKGDVLVYLPPYNMGDKTAEVIVKLDDDLQSMSLTELVKSEQPPIYREHLKSIKAQLEALSNEYRSLWKIMLCATPQVRNDPVKMQLLTSIAAEWLQSDQWPEVLIRAVAEKQGKSLSLGQAIELHKEAKSFITTTLGVPGEYSDLTRYVEAIKSILTKGSD